MLKTFQKLFIAALIPLMLWSCEDSFDGSTMTLKESGNLVYHLTDQDGEAMEGQNLYLIDLTIMDSRSEYDVTNYRDLAIKAIDSDSKGKVDFGEVNEGTYYVLGKITDDEDKTYNIFSATQVVSGTTINKTISLADYLGEVKLTVLSNITNNGYSYNPISNINIALIPYTNSDIQYLSFKTLSAMAIQLGKTDSAGIITANNLPLERYYVLAYDDSNRYDILGYSAGSSTTSITINRHEPTVTTLYAQSANFKDPVDGLCEFHVFYQTFNNKTNDMDTVNLANAGVLLSRSSSSNFSSAYNSKEIIVTTNEEGIAKVPSNVSLNYSNYSIWVTDQLGATHNFGYASTSSLIGTRKSLEVPETLFNIKYGSIDITAIAKHVDSNGTTSILALDSINLLLTKSNTTSFSYANGITLQTNESGKVSNDNIAPGNYYLWAYSNSTHAERSLQLITIKEGETTKVEAIFSAEKVKIITDKLTLNIVGMKNGVNSAITEAHVVITTSNKYSIVDALNSAIVAGKTDSNGQVSFDDLEINKNYYIMVYYDADNYYRAGYKTLTYGEINEFSIETGTSLLD